MNERKSDLYPILVDKQKILEQKVYATETFPCKKKSGLKKGEGRAKRGLFIFLWLAKRIKLESQQIGRARGKD
jgi:hypothetical protein